MAKTNGIVVNVTAKKEKVAKNLVSVQTSLSFAFDVLDALNKDGIFDQEDNAGLYGIYAQGNTGYVKVPAWVSLVHLQTLETEVELSVEIGDEETKISFVL